LVPPIYPQRAMSTRVEGNVELQYSIGADGGVRDIQVLHAQPEGVFDAAAQVAAQPVAVRAVCTREHERALHAKFCLHLERGHD